MRYLIILLILIASGHLRGQDTNVTVHALIVAQYSYEAGLLSPDVTALYQDSRGIFWVGTRGAGVFQFNEGRFVTIPDISRHISGEVKTLCELPDGQLVIETATGTFLYNGRQIVLANDQMPDCARVITTRLQTIGEQILCDLELGLGDIWVGTDKGLRSYNPIDTLWQYYSDALGLLDDPIQTFMYDSDNILWIGTRTNGLLQYVGPVNQSPDFVLETEVRRARYDIEAEMMVIQGENYRTYSLNQLVGAELISGFDSVGFENFYIDGRGYYWLEGGEDHIRVVRAEFPDSVLSTMRLTNMISAFAYDRFNTVWIETEVNRLYRGTMLQGLDQYQLASSYAAIPADEIVELIPYGANQVYRIGVGSVGLIKNDKFKQVYSTDIPIRCAHLDDSGVLWVGTKGNGIVVLQDGKPPFELDLPIPLRNVQIEFIYKKGSVLWVGTDHAVYQLILASDHRKAQRGTRILNLPRAALNRKNYTVMGSTAICVISGKAVFFLQGQGFTPQASSPRVFLTSVNLRDQALSDSKYKNSTGAYAQQLNPLSLSFSENSLSLSWQGLSILPGNMSYSYRLNPEEEWSSPSNRTALQLAGLPPGSYLFDVRVCDGKGNCGTLASPWEFEIRKAIWQNWWFWGVLIVLVFSGIISGINFREKKIREKAKRELQLLESKLHTVELEQKAMQLQMNPHFIFNAIQTIHHQLLNNKVNKAANSLVRFSTLMRTMLEMSRSEKVSLEDELEFLNAYVRVEQICRSEGIEFTLDVDEGIELFDTMIPSMMLQPVVENAIKYGGTRIILEVKLKGKYLQIRVCDNGPGFSEEDLKRDKSVALKLLRDRVAHMPGNGFVELYNTSENDVVSGACVELNIPESS